MKNRPVDHAADEEAVESESKVINQIFGCCSIQKMGWDGEDFRSICFPINGVFVKTVLKANIIAYIKAKILRPVLSITKTPFTLQPFKLTFSTLLFCFPIFGKLRVPQPKKSCNRWKLAGKSISKVKHFVIFFSINDSSWCKVQCMHLRPKDMGIGGT